MFWYYVINVLTLGYPYVIKIAVRKAIIEAQREQALAKVA